MKFPISELADRWTILKLKVERLPEDNSLIETFAIFSSELEEEVSRIKNGKQTQILALINDLYKHNATIWGLEAELRAGEMDERIDLEEIGRRAIAIRNANKLRLHAKNKIALVASDPTGFDRKIDHGSE